MSLTKCMHASGLRDHVKTGLKALGNHSKRIVVTEPQRASHSINLDEALAAKHPRDSRWDYGIGLITGQQQRIAWVEVHTATSGEVDAVLKKLEWLTVWLAGQAGPCQGTPTTFHWVATDAGVHIDPARRRRLNAAGLRMPQSQLRL